MSDLDELITLYIPGRPVKLPKAEAYRVGDSVRFYVPTKTKQGKSNGVKEFRAAVLLECHRQRRGQLIRGPVRVDCLYLFPRPAIKVWKRKPMPRYRHVAKPDIDNLDKLLFDSITQAADVDGNQFIWHDDTQVQCGFHEKWYCSGDEEPGTHVRIWILDKTA